MPSVSIKDISRPVVQQPSQPRNQFSGVIKSIQQTVIVYLWLILINKNDLASFNWSSTSASQTVKTGQVLRLLKLSNCQKQSKVVQNSQKQSKIVKTVKLVRYFGIPNCQTDQVLRLLKLSKIVKNSQKQSKIVKYSQKQSKIVKSSQKQSKIVKNSRKQSKVVKIVKVVNVVKVITLFSPKSFSFLFLTLTLHDFGSPLSIKPK